MTLKCAEDSVGVGVGDLEEQSEDVTASAEMTHFIQCETARGFQLAPVTSGEILTTKTQLNLHIRCYSRVSEVRRRQSHFPLARTSPFPW